MKIKNKPINTIFLLGGHDLEMLEIKKILKSKKLTVHDENLQWDNAKLSKYGDKLNDTDFFVGIELESDIKTPPNYLLIDHHNENVEKPSAIEQIADLLDIALNREQQLVAANDKGYIPAMIAMGATPKEIEDIRSRDRKAQGATDEDERLGEKSTKENSDYKGDVLIVKSLTNRFSTITDRLWGKTNKLLIYNEESLTYYGQNIDKLITQFSVLIEERIAYYGGNPPGFFGVDLKKLHNNEKANIIINLTNMIYE